MAHGSMLRSAWGIATSSAKNAGSAVLTAGEFLLSTALAGAAPAAVATTAGMWAGSAIGPQAAMAGGVLSGCFALLVTAKKTLGENVDYGLGMGSMLASGATTAAIALTLAKPLGL